jgi:uncharacterized protein YciI
VTGQHCFTDRVFIIDLQYVVPPDQVDKVLEPHIAYLRKHLDSGEFLTAGRKVPREGGIILVNVADRARAEELAAQDPFVVEGVATSTLTEFENSRSTPGFAALLG